jgi:hypothetical protein
MKTMATSSTDIKVADEVWVAAALLHREHARQSEVSILLCRSPRVIL